MNIQRRPPWPRPQRDGDRGQVPGLAIRSSGDPNADTKRLVELDELEDMIEVLIGDYNGESHGGVSNRTPLEAMTQPTINGHLRHQ